jgi:phospholipase C
MSELPRPDLPEGTDLLPQIRHIVILMMENHSYDNYFGMLAGRGEGLPRDPGRTTNFGHDGVAYSPRHLTSPKPPAGCPTQSWYASHVQYADGKNDGFARSVELTNPGSDPGTAMGYWTEEDLPFYYGLARTFPLADHWFSSCLGPTFPNRRFMISGTAHGLMDDMPWDLVDYPEAGTIFDMLSGHDIGWINYHNVRPAVMVAKRMLGARGVRAARRVARLGRLLPRVTQALRGNKSFTADLYPLHVTMHIENLRHTAQFFADADAGTLPPVSFVDPDFEQYSEENPQDIRRGESFAAEVINRVMHGKGWPHTLLIWTYDEGGGYYDHVPPPEAVAPDDVPPSNYERRMPPWLRTVLRPLLAKSFAELEAEDKGPGDYRRYGFRVPAVIVSPYARPDYVCTKTLDHTSVLKLIEQKWNLPPLTRRDAAADTPLDALDFDAPPAFVTPPSLPAPALRWRSW